MIIIAPQILHLIYIKQTIFLLQGFDEDSDEVENVLSIMDQLTQELIEEGRWSSIIAMLMLPTLSVIKLWGVLRVFNGVPA